MLDFLFAFAFVVFWIFVLRLFIFFIIKHDLRDVDYLVYLGRQGNYLSFAVPYNDCYLASYSIYYNKKYSLNCKSFDFVSISVSFSPFSSSGIKLVHAQVLDPLHVVSSEDENKIEVT